MESAEIKAHLVKTGWVANKSGFYCKAVEVRAPDGLHVRSVRVKFNKASLTIQLHSSVNSFWLRLGGASYDAIRRTADGGVQVISYIFPAK